MRYAFVGVFLLTVFSMWSCGKGEIPAVAASQQATLTLQDRSTFTGDVISSSPSGMTLKEVGGQSRTYPMGQIRSVRYLNPAPTQSSAQTPQANYQEGKNNHAINVLPNHAQQSIDDFRTLPAGTILQVRNNESISSQTASAGQTFSGVVARDIVDSSGQLAIPRGSDATLVVRSSNDQGRVKGRSELAIDVGSVTVGGRRYRMDTTDVVKQGRDGLGANRRTGGFVGGGAALGGIIGALAGGGKGAAIGALSGAGAGTAAQTLTRGKAVYFPSETLMTFRLEAPVRIREIL